MILTIAFARTESLRNSLKLVAREIKKLVKLRQLDTIAYADSVNKRKQASREAKQASRANPVSLSEQLQAQKFVNRAQKRKIGKLQKQVDKLRKKCRGLQTENRKLKETIKKLKAGDHDIEMDGQTQQDLTDVLRECQKSPILQEQIKDQDNTGVLKAFWDEQVARSETTDKRKRWNPVVLRFMLHLWEKMGEKNFRVLGDEKVRYVARIHCVSVCARAIQPCPLCVVFVGFTFT